MRRRALPFAILYTLSLACTDNGSQTDAAESETGDGDGDGDPGDGDGDGDPSPLRPNWHQDVAPLVVEACQGCHIDGGIAPFSMANYEETAVWAALMADQAEARLMPPWHALETEVCQPPLPYKHDPRLSDGQIQLLRDWADIGAPEGNPEDAVELPAPPNLDLANPTTTVLMSSPVEIQAQGQKLDFVHCLSIDPGNEETVYLDGIQIVAGNREILHHVLVYLDTQALSAAWPGGVQENCNGGAGINAPAELISGWVPGGLPMEPPPGVGIEVPAGARLIMNVHYHATNSGPQQDSGTGLALRWTTQAPEWDSLFVLLGAPGLGDSLTGPLMIPANEAGHVEEYEWVISQNGNTFPDSVEVRVWAVANHMHLVGVDMRAWVEDRDTGEETCLIHTPYWDFDWQRIYEYDAPADQGVRVKAGDIVHVRCEFDNTLGNPGVVRALAELGLEAPINVGLGEGTLDEMCLTAIGAGVRLP